MEDLDGDESPLFCHKHGKYISRDIVQFVPFRDVKNDPVMLTKKVLQELPQQVVEYFMSKGMKPNTQIVDNTNDIETAQNN